MKLNDFAKKVLKEKSGVLGIFKDIVEELTEELVDTSGEYANEEDDLFSLHYETTEIDEEQIKAGDHIQVLNGSTSHHGIYIGDKKVVHKMRNEILESTFEAFKGSGKVVSVLSGKLYNDAEIVNRAMSKLLDQHNIRVFRDSVHFAAWCREGD